MMEKKITPFPPADSRKSTFTEDIRDFFMNSRNLLSYKKRAPRLDHENEQVCVLGQVFSLKKDHDLRSLNRKIEEAFGGIIWFSYRKNFPILKPKKETTFISDTGWGCSLRVGQMIFAEVLKRHLAIKAKKIIPFFSDCQTDPAIAPFGIQQVTVASSELFSLKPGDWFKFTHVLLLFENLYQNYATETIPGLDFLLFSDGIIFINQIYEKISSYSSCPDCRNSKHGQLFRDKLCAQCRKFQKSLFLTVCIMPGLDYLRPEDYPFVSEMLSSRFSVGLMGGKPRRARYFVSAMHGDLLGKDPHFVQDACEDLDDISSYFTDEVKYVNIAKMSSSLAFGFYFRNEQDYEEFEDFLRAGKAKLGEKWLMGFEEEFYREEEFNKLLNEDEEEEFKEIEEIEENSLVIIDRKKKKGLGESLENEGLEVGENAEKI